MIKEMATTDMRSFKGETLSWDLNEDSIELTLHREPANEIGLQTLGEVEKFIEAHETLKDEAHSLIIYSTVKAGFSAGADLRALYYGAKEAGFSNAAPQIRDFLNRIHRVMNT